MYANLSLRFTVTRPLIGAAIAFMMTTSFANAQPPRYYPLDQTVSPGTAGQWAAILHPGVSEYYQPIRIELPNAGQVTFYTMNGQSTPRQATPANAAFLVGRVYRLRISDIAEYPGVELFPTVELLDRLHPPPGKATRFPVPIAFTEEEIDFALEGRLVTKVVYVEQPDLAEPVPNSTAALTRRVEPRDNALQTADRLGRPIAIVRLGGRVPDPNDLDPAFFGSGAPVLLPQPVASEKGIQTVR